MNAANFILQDYLDRIGFTGEAGADMASIARMMTRQLHTVPFENLDVQAGKIVSLQPEDIVSKIVGGQRGGYCYEVNGLFAMALAALGIDYFFVAARPMFYPVRRPKTHMAIVARIDGKSWLIDLGFGSYGIRQPVDLDTVDTELLQDGDRFKLSHPNPREYLLQALVAGEWINQYAFEPQSVEWIDFAPANYLNSTHPEAIFVQKYLVVLHNPQGRKILLGDTLKIVRGQEVDKQIVPAAALADVLERHFGLVAPARGERCP